VIIDKVSRLLPAPHTAPLSTRIPKW